MSTISKVLPSILFFVILSSNLYADGAKWIQDFDLAKKLATKENKMILANFTGSDWCPYCIKAESEIFSTDAFAKYASDKFILLKIDFPQKKKLPRNISSQNEKLAIKYNVSGFPTFLILDSSGELLGITGYMQGGVKAWIATCEDILKSIPPKTVLLKDQDFTKVAVKAKKENLPILLFVYDSKVKNSFAKIKAIGDKRLFSTLDGWKFIPFVTDKAQLEANAKLSKIKPLLSSTTSGQYCILLDSKSIDKSNAKVFKYSDADNFFLNLYKNLSWDYDGKWIADYNKAKIIAKAQNKAILLRFTGSDWCKWCKKMDEDIFSKEEFIKYAQKSLVLVNVDFPKNFKLSPAQAKQNDFLARAFGIEGLPTIIVLNKDAKMVMMSNYYAGEPSIFIKEIDSRI